MKKTLVLVLIAELAMAYILFRNHFRIVNFLEYSGQTAEIIEEIEEKYGIIVSSPTTVEGKKNLPWSQTEIEFVRGGLEAIPFELRKGVNRIWLYKPEGTSGGPGGNYTDGSKRVELYLPADFDPDAPAPEKERLVFGNNGAVIKGVVVHEFAHNYEYYHPEILERWIEVTGWKKEGENWVIDDSTRIDFRGSNINPDQDFAISTSVVRFSPLYLSENRVNFFFENEPFSNWLQEYYDLADMAIFEE